MYIVLFIDHCLIFECQHAFSFASSSWTPTHVDKRATSPPVSNVGLLCGFSNGRDYCRDFSSFSLFRRCLLGCRIRWTSSLYFRSFDFHPQLCHFTGKSNAGHWISRSFQQRRHNWEKIVSSYWEHQTSFADECSSVCWDVKTKPLFFQTYLPWYRLDFAEIRSKWLGMRWETSSLS